jgi:Porin subfamily
MKLTKSLLLGSAAAVVAVSAGYAADLPSKKAAPASYVKICDAYGAGFFYIPGTDTCVKLGGYVRVEAQYVPGSNVYSMKDGSVVQLGINQDSTGLEERGRIDVDARTQSAWGTVQTAVSLRGTNASGLRVGSYSSTGVVYNNTGLGSISQSAYGIPATSQANLTMEKAFIRFAGITAGVAPENYGMMPSFNYNGNPWTGYPNGMPQLAYTATFGGGWSATLALEDVKAGNYAQIVADTPSTQISYVGNIRLDQTWGFAAIHAALVTNSWYSTDPVKLGTSGFASTSGKYTTATYTAPDYIPDPGVASISTKQGYAFGATTKINLPMIASGDALWLTANYANGNIGQLLSNGNLMNLSSSSGGRVLGGLFSAYTNTVPTAGGSGGATSTSNTTGWNVAGELTHYWAPQWRSNVSAGYVDLKSPNSAYIYMGESKLTELMGSLIWSPVKDFDIGVEVQYLHLSTGFNSNSAINTYANAVAAAGVSTSADNLTTKLRLERSF